MNQPLIALRTMLESQQRTLRRMIPGNVALGAMFGINLAFAAGFKWPMLFAVNVGLLLLAVEILVLNLRTRNLIALQLRALKAFDQLENIFTPESTQQ